MECRSCRLTGGPQTTGGRVGPAGRGVARGEGRRQSWGEVRAWGPVRRRRRLSLKNNGLKKAACEIARRRREGARGCGGGGGVGLGGGGAVWGVGARGGRGLVLLSRNVVGGDAEEPARMAAPAHGGGGCVVSWGGRVGVGRRRGGPLTRRGEQGRRTLVLDRLAVGRGHPLGQGQGSGGGRRERRGDAGGRGRGREKGGVLTPG